MRLAIREQPAGDGTQGLPEEVTAKTILYGVLQRSGVELSAHQTIRAEQEPWSSFAQVAAEYLTLAAEAQRDRWIDELRAAGLTNEQLDTALTSDSFGPLTAELRRAEANGHDVAELLPRLVAQRALDDAHDVSAVLISRLRHARSRTGCGNSARTRLIAGLIPEATGPMTADMRRALVERQDLLESRATALAETAVAQRAAWLRRLGEPPPDRLLHGNWITQVRIVAAYRDRYGVDGGSPVGADAMTDAQRLDAARAKQAVQRARGIAQKDAGHVEVHIRPTGHVLG